MRRRVAHLSDLHFGREDPDVVAALAVAIGEAMPDLVVVSGDLTQRARTGEFARARAFLEALPAPSLVVPGNHDIPLHNPIRRFVRPLDRFGRFFAAGQDPVFVDEALLVIGLNTARSLTWKDGRVSRAQMVHLADTVARLGGPRMRIVVAHHPFVQIPTARPATLVGRLRPALRALVDAGIDLVLSGHEHREFTGDLSDHHPTLDRSILVAQAGTAMSTRIREEANSFNLLELAVDHVALAVMAWNGTRFHLAREARFQRRGGVWRPEGALAALGG